MAVFTRLLFKMMPHLAGMVSYSDQLLMYDNLDTDLSEMQSTEFQNFIKLMPIKINFTVVLLCLEGGLDIKCNLIDYSVGKNGLVVVPPGSKAERLEILDGSKIIALVLPDASYAPPSTFHNAVYSTPNFSTITAIELEDSEVKQGVHIYKMLKEQLKGEGSEVNSDLVKAYILLMGGVAAVAFQRWKIRSKKTKVSNKEQIYKDFLNHLEDDYRGHRDVAYYAGLAGLTPKYFASVVFEASGSHPIDLIKKQVVQDAKEQLRAGNSIAQVCESLNFTSQSQFTSYFKSVMGIPPGEFLRSGTNI